MSICPIADRGEQEPALAVATDGLRVDHVEPQSVVQRQLRSDPPGVLRVVEVPPLALARVGERADVAAEVRHVAEQERREAEAAAVRPARPIDVERQLARSMDVAWHPEIPRAADVSAELHGVIALNMLRHVADELQLLLVLIQRTIAAVDAEARSELNCGDSLGPRTHRTALT